MGDLAALGQPTWQQQEQFQNEMLDELYDIPAPRRPGESLFDYEMRVSNKLTAPGLGRRKTEQIQTLARTSGLSGESVDIPLEKRATALLQHPLRQQQFRETHKYWSGFQEQHQAGLAEAKKFAWIHEHASGKEWREKFAEMDAETWASFLEGLPSFVRPKERKGFPKVKAALRRGTKSIGENFRDFAERFVGEDDPERFKPTGASRFAEAQRVARGLDPTAGPEAGLLKRGLLGGVEMAPAMLAGGALSFVNPGVGVAFWTTQIAPARTSEFINRGMSLEQAKRAGLITGMLEGVIEMVGRLAGPLPKGWRAAAFEIVKRYGKEWVEEPTQEMVSEVVYSIAAKDPNVGRTVMQVWESAKESAIPVAVLGAGGAVVGKAGQVGAEAAGAVRERARALVEFPERRPGIVPGMRRAGEFELPGGAAPMPVQRAMTPEGAREIARQRPDVAALLMAKTKPTRKELADAGITGASSAADRQKIARVVGEAVEEVARAEGIAREAGAPGVEAGPPAEVAEEARRDLGEREGPVYIRDDAGNWVEAPPGEEAGRPELVGEEAVEEGRRPEVAKPTEPTVAERPPAAVRPKGFGDLAGKLSAVEQGRVRGAVMEISQMAPDEMHAMDRALLEEIIEKRPKSKEAEWARRSLTPVLAGEPEVGPVEVIPFDVDKITVDPALQFRIGKSKRGTTGRLAPEGVWEPQYAGDIALWHNPETGEDLVVNGFHRVAKAQDTGAKQVNAFFIEADSIEDAYVQGAMMNIADGNATLLETAKVIRDSGETPEDLRARGLNVSEGLAERGVALSRLDSNVWNAVLTGEIPEAWGASIGRHVADETHQRKLYQMLKARRKKGRKITVGMVSEMAQMVEEAPVVEEAQMGLWEPQFQNLAEQVASIREGVRAALGQEKRLFAAVTKEGAIGILARHGTYVDVESAEGRKRLAAVMIERFDIAKRTDAGVREAINAGAERVAEGAKTAAVVREVTEDVTRLLGTDVQRPGRAEGRAARGEAEQATLFPGGAEPPAGEVTPKLSAAREAQERADRGPQLEMLGAGVQPPRGRQPIRTDTIVESIEADRPEVEARIRAASGIRKPGLLARAWEVMKVAAAQSTRPQEHLPKTAEFASANEGFRQLKVIPEAVKDDVRRTVKAMIDPLGPQEFMAFERKVILDNQVASLHRGELRRFGFEDRAEVERELAKVDAVVDQLPKVEKALATRKAVVTELVKQLVEEDLLPADALDNAENYYHQQVHMYQEARRIVSGRSARPGKQTYQMARVKGVTEDLGPEYDYNTNYLEAEIAWMTSAHEQLRKIGVLRQYFAPLDVKAQLQAEAKERGVEWTDVLRERDDYDAWQPDPGNYFFQAFALPEKLAQELLTMKVAGEKSILESVTLGLNLEDMRTVLAMGARKTEMVLPSRVVAQLEALEKPRPTGTLAKLAQALHSRWKQWTLQNPKRAFAYNVRNLSGDTPAVLAGAPKALKNVPRAARELRRYHGGYLALPDKLRSARDLGVVQSSMTAVEIEHMADTRVDKLLGLSPESLAGTLAKPFTQYFETVKNVTEERENNLRYATFLYFDEQIENGTLTEYGGARKEVVDALIREFPTKEGKRGSEVAAAHLARNLLGDYGDLTVLGEYLRKNWYSFWSFQEINLKRWPRLAINAFQQGKLKGGGALLASSAYTAIALTQLAGFYAAMWAFNNLLFRDEEDDLGEYDRQNPHIITGRNPDGSVRVFRNTGALGDFLEWFGINTLISLYPKYRDGQLTGKELVTEIAKSPINKVVGGLRPDIKGAAEILTGESYFPDVFEPRTVDRGEVFAAILGLQDEWREARGRLFGTGERARPNYWQRWLVGVVEPKRNALHEIYDLRERYLKKQGKERPPFRGISPFKPIRDAAMMQNFDAFLDARDVYIEGGRTYKNFLNSLKYLDPISQRLNDKDEKAFEQEFLNSEQRQKLKVARDYAHDLQITLWKWWQDAEKIRPSGPEALKEWKVQVGRAAYRLSEAKRTRKDWTDDVEYLRALRLTQAEAVKMLETHTRKRGDKTEMFIQSGKREGDLTAFGKRVYRLMGRY